MNNQVVVPSPQPPSESQSLIAVISNAAKDPSVDLVKMQGLMELYERIEAKRAETAFNASMSVAQTSMRPIQADMTNPQTRSLYASYAKLDSKLRPIYTQNGFALSFDTATADAEGYIRVLCYVTHKDGFSRIYRVDMPADGKGAKGGDVMTKTHATGAGMTYGMRYLLKMIFNVAVGEDDNDGNTQQTQQQNNRRRGPVTPVDSPERDALYLRLSDIATQGAEAYATAWGNLTKGERTMIGVAAHEGLKADALEADRVREGGAE